MRHKKVLLLFQYRFQARISGQTQHWILGNPCIAAISKPIMGNCHRSNLVTMYEAIGQTMRLRSGLFIFEKFLLLARNGRDVKVISNRKYALKTEAMFDSLMLTPTAGIFFVLYQCFVANRTTCSTSTFSHNIIYISLVVVTRTSMTGINIKHQDTLRK